MIIGGPQMVDGTRWQPVQDEFTIRDQPPTSLRTIDTSAVYVHAQDFADSDPWVEDIRYRYFRFRQDGVAFGSELYPDSVDIQQAVLKERGLFGYWTNADPVKDTPERAFERIKIEMYHPVQQNFIYIYARVYIDHMILYRETSRGLGYSDTRHEVYRIHNDVDILPPLTWPE